MTDKKPRPRMKISVSLVRVLTLRPQMTGIGRTAKKKSVAMLIAAYILELFSVTVEKG